MRSRLLSSASVLGHLAVTTVLVGTLLLAWWQWDRSQSAAGTFQNLGYALQWPLFGAFAVYMWVAMLRRSGQRSLPSSRENAQQDPDGAAADAVDLPPSLPSKRGRRPASAGGHPAGEREDPGGQQLRAYNAYLAALREDQPPFVTQKRDSHRAG